ncbi:MAG: hypothetical protein WCC74_01395 [Minisyncoccia bacterium]
MNRSFLTSLKLIIILTAISICPIFSFAQTPNSQAISGSSMTISPINPKFRDTITASLKNIYQNLNTEQISWFVDGTLKKEGVGLTSFSFDLSNKSQSTTVKAVINSTNVLEQVIQPRDINIIFEPQSYTPNFYKGSPLFAKQGTVKALAIPEIYIDGTKIPDKSLTYTWMKNGVVDEDASGRGKNTFVFSGNGISDDTDIDVTVQDDNRKVTAEKIISISPTSPKILMYEDNPLYGIFFNKALTGVINIGSKEEMDIIAFPFYFDVKEPDSSRLNMTWSVNGQSYTTAGKKNTIILKQVETSGSGSANISINVENRDRMFQFGRFGFTLNYEK